MHRVRIAREVVLQPERAFEVEIVGRLVEQQQVGLAKRARAASATRMRQPPEKDEAGPLLRRRRRSRGRRGCVAARASAECASMSASRMWISAMRCGSVAVSASASSAARSVSASSTISISGSSVPGASCATWPMRVFFGSEIEPVSATMSPVMARNSVVLPAPLRPTRPAFVPAGKVSEAWSRSRRPAMRSERSLMISMAGAFALDARLSQDCQQLWRAHRRAVALTRRPCPSSVRWKWIRSSWTARLAERRQDHVRLAAMMRLVVEEMASAGASRCETVRMSVTVI